MKNIQQLWTEQLLKKKTDLKSEYFVSEDACNCPLKQSVQICRMNYREIWAHINDLAPSTHQVYLITFVSCDFIYTTSLNWLC